MSITIQFDVVKIKVDGDLKYQLYNDFISKNKRPQCVELTSNAFNTKFKFIKDDKSFIEKAKETDRTTQWFQDYCKIRLNLYENGFKKIVDKQLYSKFQFKRNQIGYLPELSVELMNELTGTTAGGSGSGSGSNNNNNSAKLYLLRNGLVSFWRCFYLQKQCSRSNLVLSLMTYIYEYVMKMRVFDNTQNIADNDIIIKMLFNGNKDAYNWLIDYCIQDIGNAPLYIGKYMGIKHIISNRMLYLLYKLFIHDESESKRKNEISRETNTTTTDTDSEMNKYKEDIRGFFELMFDFSVYIAISPHPTELAELKLNDNEIDLIKQFLYWQPKCYNYEKYCKNNMFVGNETVLHRATYLNKAEKTFAYAQLLVSKGEFDPFTKLDGRKNTAYDVAEQWSPIIKTYFDQLRDTSVSAV